MKKHQHAHVMVRSVALCVLAYRCLIWCDPPQAQQQKNKPRERRVATEGSVCCVKRASAPVVTCWMDRVSKRFSRGGSLVLDNLHTHVQGLWVVSVTSSMTVSPTCSKQTVCVMTALRLVISSYKENGDRCFSLAALTRQRE